MNQIETLAAGQDDLGQCWRLSNRHGASVLISSWGATILELWVPDNHGQLNDVVLGYAQHRDYQKNRDMLGCVVGPYANRIANGQLTINQRSFQLPCNNGKHHLHGGQHGLHHQHWQLLEQQEDETSTHLILGCQLNAETCGYPADYELQVCYQWNDLHQLSVSYQARANRDTVINVTQHSYFNLGGVESIETILDHHLWLAGDHVCEVNHELIPTGELIPTNNNCLDFRHNKAIRDQWDLSDPLLMNTNGLDHNWVNANATVPNKAPHSLAWVAALFEPNSQRHLKIFSDQPGIQIYSGNFLNVENGKYHQHYLEHTGICLETQHFPDSPNHAHFPSTLLSAGDCFRSTSVYEFGTGELRLER